MFDLLIRRSALITNRFKKRTAMTDKLNHVDICFVVDTTGSMGAFIGAAQKHLLDMMAALTADSGIDLQVGLVEFRDHPPQDQSFVTRSYPLTGDFRQMQKVVNDLRADGGGDAPEAVYDGVYEAATLMDWRTHSCRFVLLVGDSPPHGFKLAPTATDEEIGAGSAPGRGRGRRRAHAYVYDHGDTWPDGCPCGLDARRVTAAAENQRATVHALCMTGSETTVGAFGELARSTGGECASSQNAEDVLGKMIEMLDREFRNLAFDREVLKTVLRVGDLDAGALAEHLHSTRLQTASAIARLGRRGFLASGDKRYALIQ